MGNYLKIQYSFALMIISSALLCTAAIPRDSILYYDEQLFEVDGETWRLVVPSNYELELLVEMRKPRMLTVTDDDVLLVGSSVGNLYRIKPPYQEVEKWVDLGGFPHSVAVRNGELLVGMTDGVYHAPYNGGSDAVLDRRDFELLAELPGGGGHASRTVAVGPDNRIYLSLGISGNCSDQYIGAGYSFDRQRGGILVLSEPPGQKPRWQPFASGLRNPVGFAWHPNSKVLYASNNGPDHHGYELPAEYFSRIDAGSFHGMPWFWLDKNNRLVLDDCIDSQPPRRDAQIPVATFPARSSPMGVAFVPVGAFAPHLAGSAAVAIHGSWGTQPHGSYFGSRATRRAPSIALVYFIKDKVADVVTLLGGLQDAKGNRLARPMGVAFTSDGTLYFTSDGGDIEGLFRLRLNR